jgi:hypothetical protein
VLPLKHKDFIICLFNRKSLHLILLTLSVSWICSKNRNDFFYKQKIERPNCTYDGIHGVTACFPSGHIWYKTDFRTLLLDEILNFAWFSHRQALNGNRGPMLQN